MKVSDLVPSLNKRYSSPNGNIAYTDFCKEMEELRNTSARVVFNVTASKFMFLDMSLEVEDVTPKVAVLDEIRQIRRVSEVAAKTFNKGK